MSEKKKILIADASRDLVDKILEAPGHERYEFAIAVHGEEVLAMLDSFKPALLVVDLTLPDMHGIELIKRIKTNPRFEELGVILASTNSMIQNFHAAIKEGVDFFLAKPIEIEFLYALFARYFAGTLIPEPFSPKDALPPASKELYLPKEHPKRNYLKLWGTRGSNPVSGADYIRFGGNTACLEISCGSDIIIIDAGTGIRPLGDVMHLDNSKKIHLFLSHTHWDHLTGFPFFSPLYHPDVEINIWSPVGFEKSTKELFTEMLAYAYFPVRLEDMEAKLNFHDLRDGHSVSIGEITIDSHYAYHPGATLCFKIHLAGKTIGYATDNEMFLGYHGHPEAIQEQNLLLKTHESILNFFQNCDTLIHEAQYTPLEYQKRVGWGHSSISNAAILCKQTKTKHWIVTHHDPQHTDADLLQKLHLHKDILADCHHECSVEMAFDGMELPI